ncbi:MAG: methylenetetrahydrofolate reductase [Treponema sp.]|jgi:methylenetetrahydrofolate reductase (NADPH)|nr:methylenetetrahydrofolate reductase [Treponema sp.]
MMVSLEAVPRSAAALKAAAAAAAEFSRITIINVPDLLRFPIRSWEACGILSGSAAGVPASDAPPTGAVVPGAPAADTGASAAGKPVIPLCFMPHLRAVDYDPAKPFPHAGFFRRAGIRACLAVKGDLPAGNVAAPDRPFYPAETTAFIKKLKAELPDLEVYAAFDPYRTNIRYELDYVKAKEDAGAAGFMSQPFFDLRLLEIYAEYLEGKQVFWGVSPVLSAANRNYWESRNRAVFPRNFRPDLYWNVDFGRRVLRFCEDRNFHLYLMPIKVDLAAYLSGVLG